MGVAIEVDRGAIAAFCRRRHVRRLALFGSVLRSDYGPGSDVDILVEFERDHIPGLIGMGAMAEELSAVLGVKDVDLRTAEDLSEYFRDDVLAEAQVQYEQA